MTPAPKDDHTDKQALREEIEKAARVHFDVAVAGEDGFDRPQKVVEIRLDELLGIIDAYTEQRVREAEKRTAEYAVATYKHNAHKDAEVIIQMLIDNREAQLKASTREGE